jgi:hypothetical protein
VSELKLVAQAAVAALALGGCHEPSYLSYDWSPRQVLCSDSYDDLSAEAPWALIEDELEYAHDAQRVALFHAHGPGQTVSIDAIERIISLAEKNHLEFLEYKDLVPGPRRAGVALAFDDNWVDQWLGIRDLLTSHDVRATFFICRYEIITDAERAGIEVLAADGHDIEPHTVHHLHYPEYVQEYGLDQYMTDEVLPSMQELDNAGHPASTFAYPFGQHTKEADDAILAVPGILRVRTTPGECPW